MSCSEIVIKKKGKKKCKISSSSVNTLTSDCYTDKTSCSSSGRSSSSGCSSQPSIEVIELTTSSSSSSECSRSGSSSSDCCPGGRKNRYNRRCGGRNCNGCNSCSKPGRTFGDCYYCFYAIVAPLSNFQLLNGATSVNGLKISVVISGKTTTLSWEGFSGNITSSGIAFVYISQFFKGLPMYDVFSSYLINYAGGDTLSTVQVLANNTNTIQWYIQANRRGTGVSSNSYIAVYAGSVTYINNCESC